LHTHASSDRAAPPSHHPCAPAFGHRALLYADEDEFIEGALPFVRGALEGEEAVMVAVTRPRARALRGELGPDAELVRFVDMEQLGRNPARIIPAWRRFVDAHVSPTRAVRGIGEPVWPGRSAEELAECDRHESLLNLAFAGSPRWELLCPYDTSALEDPVLEGACRNHPQLHSAGALCESEDYLAPDRAPHPFNGELAEPDGTMFVEMHAGLQRLAVVRQMVATQASAAGLEPTRTSDLVLAVNELVSNSVSHGSGHGTLRIWRTPASLICEVGDHGRIQDPLAGRREPTPDQARGRGLWIANQICDLVQIRSSAFKTVVRVHMTL
jgi:anti-sigma regulatory factor (Ser/Thr protein kinase)